MFSAEDTVDIYRLVPPEKTSGLSGGLPLLLLSSTGTGFLTLSYVVGEFERIATTQPARISVSNVSTLLDVDDGVVIHLATTSPNLALVSEDKEFIITKSERDEIEQRLREAISNQLVSKATFSRENAISTESLAHLAHLQGESTVAGDDLTVVEDYFLGKLFQQKLRASVKQHLDDALKNAIPTQFSPEMLPGSPPQWFIGQTLDQVLDSASLLSEFHVTETAGKLLCIPKQSVLRKRDAQVASLMTGETSFIDLRGFLHEFRDLYPGYSNVQDDFSTLSEVDLVGSFAVSQQWISTFGDQCASDLEKDGYVFLASRMQQEFPSDVRKAILDKVEQHMTTAQPQQPDLKYYRSDSLILAPATYDSERTVLFNSARIFAQKQWEQLKVGLGKDLKFHMVEITATISENQNTLRIIAEEKATQKALEEHFWAEVSELESQNETEFSTFWVERVLSRVHNYTDGLDGVEDGKLRDQLADLLAAYFQKELIPDAISKARSQGLMCSRKSRKNIQKLETLSQGGKLDVPSAVAAVEKFSRKQGVQELDEASPVEAKSVLISDMARRMQKKQVDGPLLFLTLVIILLAKENAGVVYATGKYAPKLMKQLKRSLSAEQYGKLEHWKEMAKTGTLTPEDREGMRAWILQSK